MSGRQDLNLRPLDPQITAHRSHSASCQVKRHLQAAPGLLSVLSLLYSAAVLRGRRPAGPARPGRFEHGAASHSGRPVRDHHTPSVVEPATSRSTIGEDIVSGVYESGGAQPDFFGLCLVTTHSGKSKRSDMLSAAKANPREPVRVSLDGNQVRAVEASGCENFTKVG